MDLLANVSTTMPEMASWEFWLGVPARVLMILLIAVVASAAIRLIIRRITRGIEKGTRSRVIRKLDSGRPQWVEDAGLARKRQAQRAQTVGSVLASVLTLTIWAVALLMIVSELGFNIAPVLASAGIAGVALSFGAQSLVKDYLSGIFMVAEDQLGIGDVVDLGEASGVVEDVGLRVTQVRDVQGTLWHVRNGEILRVGNQSQGWARAVLDIPLPYDGDLDAMIERLTNTLANLREDATVGEFVLGDPEVWGVEALTGESVTVRVVVKTAPAEQWAVSRVMRVRVKKMLDAAGLSVPLVNQTMVRGGGNLYAPPADAAPTDQT
ncbi:mechanosensitive ion channel family protein [Kocuria soli]|uniref:Mechanosensitive ion channel family protein n=1 Tax=Kocuria soli TaxID=2485125 RepID=A0A3N3ZSH0_9MICC|nr:mechanosensitive ion channel family protein [Kocuria soli]